MTATIKDAIKNRRTYYDLSNSSPISDNEIKAILDLAISHVPSAFNSQSTRVVLLLGDHHKQLWTIAKETLRKIVPADAFPATEARIENCFASGYGTILFYEDQSVVEGLQKTYPAYSDNFPTWSQQASAMHQFAIWTLLVNEGLGVSLQHYNPIIDAEVAKKWNINPTWKLVAQMPFGTPAKNPGEKSIQPLNQRVLVFK